MPPVKSNNSNRDDLILTVLSELKVLGVKVPKHKKFNQKFEISKPEKSDQDTRCKIFGVHLCDQEWVSVGEFFLPKFLALSTAYLQKYTGKEIGLFRKAGNVARQKKLRVILELGGNLEDCEPNDIASLLKQWLRELPEPLITLPIQDLLMKCLQLEQEENCVTACLLACLLLLPDHLHTLKHLLQFLSDIAIDSAKNKMDVYNLAVIMAPNVFSMQEPSEKNKSNLVKQHTSLMKTLIENCNKIGDVPTGISLDKFYASSELDSSSELLDSTAHKSKKKCKSGPVQEIFSGFKKLVGQNGTPNAKNNTPEPNLRTSCRSRSLSKRKAGSELQSLSAVNKKQARSLDDLDNPSLNLTPKQKGMPPNNNASGHVRRKSIGALLRRKDRKRFKSCKLSQEVSQLERKSPKCTEEDEQKNSNLEVSKDKQILSAEVDLQSKSIKKSVSDGQLPSNKPEFSVQPVMFASSSQGCLPAKQQQISRRNLRSQALSNSHLGEANILDVGSKRDEKGKRTSNRAKDSTPTENLSEANTDKKQNISHLGMMPQNNHKVEAGVNEATRKSKIDLKLKECENILIPKRRSPRSNTPISKQNVSVLRDQNRKKSKNDTSTSLNTFQNDEVLNYNMTTQNLGMKRQEAFIAKCYKKNLTNSSCAVEETENCNKQYFNDFTPQLRDRTSVSSKSARVGNNKRNTADQKGMKRRTRHGSLMRGRPNSVNNGLQSSHPNRFYNNPNVVLNTPALDSTSQEEILRYHESRIAESPVLQSLDLSLTTLFQNFTLFSPSNFAQIDSNGEICSGDNASILKQNTTPDKMKRQNIARHITNEISYVNLTPNKIKEKQDISLIAKDAEDVTPLLKKRKRLSSKSDSKIPPIKRRLNPKRGKSFSCNEFKPKQKISACESTFDFEMKQEHKNAEHESSFNVSSTSFSSEKLKSPLNSSEQNLNMSYGNQRMNDSCFKTPVNHPVSPESEVWMSGSTFLNILSPPHDEVFNKRESIAMILKNNTGHVQAKVDLYDNAKGVHSGSSKKKDSQSMNLLRTPSQQCYSARKVYNTRNLGSDTRGSSTKSRIKFQKSPLPPPPKFILTDLNTPSPKAMQPLKEVTNITPRIDEINIVVSPKKFKKSISPTLHTKSPLKLKKETPKSEPKLKKLKRNSFSGTTPYKLSKRVSRSESSPACRRRVIVVKE